MIDSSLVWKMRVRFGGKSLVKEYVSKDVRRANPGWGDELFNNGIESLEFFLPTGHRIILAGMEQYNFFVEALQDLGGQGRVDIQALWFMGKYPGSERVEGFRIENGLVVRGNYRFGKEWGGTPTRGWKPGIVGSQPVATIV